MSRRKSTRGFTSLFRRQWQPTDFGPHSWGDVPGARLTEGSHGRSLRGRRAKGSKSPEDNVTTLCRQTAALTICECEPRCA